MVVERGGGGVGHNARRNFLDSMKTQYQQRVAADPNFATKSLVEVLTAAGTQFMAEVSRRGAHGIIPEIDFVLAGLLTAVAGKYYSMWRVAPTAQTTVQTEPPNQMNPNKVSSIAMTNAFQPTLLDGSRPTLGMRLWALVAPMPQLFRAGVIASGIGYGLTALLIGARQWALPQYVTATQSVSLWKASVYTGAFMSIVSNIRYQVLSGILEPRIVEPLLKPFPPIVRSATIFALRWANGLLGSVLAITGMKFCGLQKLK
eukprot:CAMPEP_0198302906 /NCGR_PEP_ID=MMETSP1449-20131203/56614_1 /TAXON_ID=420275 /ORGANISM="Attheya septentrionalis, Strain CCMP2084" /LENGTH=258 /DNA_ID=CAMNT_0044005385 /DNA_START=235 /DNA_END=1011 /DNA_ORIENTATION=-